MSDTADRELLDLLMMRLASEPGFISHDLSRWQKFAGNSEPLGEVDAPALRRLALCRTPRRGSAFAADLDAISSTTGIESGRLAYFYRQLDALEVLASVGSTAAKGMLVAARDVADEEATFVDMSASGGAIAAGALPGWLAEVTERFWDGRPPSSFPRDLELHILLTLPIAVIEIPDLDVTDMRMFLGPEAAAQLVHLPDRQLHACLLAYAGVGIVFTNVDDDPAERRVNLAHEVAHFLLDYLAVRDRLTAHDPDLVDIMDGLRAATPEEELSALIANIPLGIQAHLLERNYASIATRAATTAEDRAEMVAWELLAPRADALGRAPNRRPETFTWLLVHDYGLPAGVAAAYGRFLTRLTASRGDSWLGLDD